jgi:hypothetical protein
MPNVDLNAVQILSPATDFVLIPLIISLMSLSSFAAAVLRVRDILIFLVYGYGKIIISIFLECDKHA